MGIHTLMSIEKDGNDVCMCVLYVHMYQHVNIE